jgi:hypothetical protein
MRIAYKITEDKKIEFTSYDDDCVVGAALLLTARDAKNIVTILQNAIEELGSKED